MIGADAQPVHHAGAEVFDQHIGTQHQLFEDCAPAPILEVQRQRGFACILRQKADPHAARRQRGISAEVASQITAAHRLDLDHFGAKMGKLLAGEGTRQHICQIENPHAPQGGRGLSRHRPRPPP